MPLEHPQSQSHARPASVGHRSTNSIHSQTDSPSSSPPHHGKPKVQKHVVGGGRVHTRVPSNKGMHKLTKSHGIEGSQENLKKLGRNASATHLKKNSSHVSLKRNRSSADVNKRPKTSDGNVKRPASVHFEIGDQDDGWEEASSSASPALSRSASRHSSAKHSASNSRPESPQSPTFKQPPHATNGANEKWHARHPADAKVITERLLLRTPSYNTTKMSLATAAPAIARPSSPDSLGKSQSSTVNNSTPRVGSKEELISRFVGGSGTPSESLHYLHPRNKSESQSQALDDIKRAQSMGNLRKRGSSNEEEEESALAPRSRNSSTHTYNPLQQSRTQQKLWLQRASSSIEPQQLAPGVALNGLHSGMSSTTLVGAGYDGRDPRIKMQLERTGLEYLVVRRHQDPIGKALRRLSQLPGSEKNRRIPGHVSKKSDGNGPSRLGLSQSLKDVRRKENNPTGNAGRSSFEASDTSGRVNGEDDGVNSILRSMWEKNLDLSSSAD